MLEFIYGNFKKDTTELVEGYAFRVARGTVWDGLQGFVCVIPGLLGILVPVGNGPCAVPLLTLRLIPREARNPKPNAAMPHFSTKENIKDGG